MINDNNKNENDEQKIKNESLKCPEAYFPVEDKLVNVEYALNIRANSGRNLLSQEVRRFW